MYQPAEPRKQSRFKCAPSGKKYITQPHRLAFKFWRSANGLNPAAIHPKTLKWAYFSQFMAIFGSISARTARFPFFPA
ncbi:MAG: hypothetical protein KGH75_08110 [Rhodospirillales bacterium]|nr:hypothetical protein [Rhodospirillales bacterium]